MNRGALGPSLMRRNVGLPYVRLGVRRMQDVLEWRRRVGVRWEWGWWWHIYKITDLYALNYNITL
jgi:hypothetical protein